VVQSNVRVNRHMQYQLLGPVEVLEDGQRLAVAGGKTMAVLALLALNANRVVSRGAVLEAVWPGEGESARRSLEVHISRLRKALSGGHSDGGPIQSQGGGYQLVADTDAVDVVCFERLATAGQRAVDEQRYDAALTDLEAARALWRGKPLEELDAYPFAVAEADRLEEARLGVLEARFQAELALGHHHSILTELRTVATAHPERESLHYQLMLALYRDGRQADALTAYAQTRHHLIEQLGIEPNPALRDLQHRILTHDEALTHRATDHDPALGDSQRNETPPPQPAATQRGTDTRTFLFADMRGYTRFTQEHGDDAASTLAGRFADLVREAVPEFEGELLELRGDEALCVFRSARQALRASVEIQRRLRTGTDDEPAFPLGVGMGLDAGEAVPTQGGYRGASLNLAARLCAIAKPGQVLASDAVVHMAQRVEGLRFARRRPVRLKGMAAVRPVEVVSEIPLPPVPAAPAPTRHLGWGPLLGFAVLAVAVVAGVVVLALRSSASHGSVVGRADAVAVIDLSGAVRAQVAVGSAPAAVAVGKGSVWVVNQTSDSVAQLSADGRVVDPSILVGRAPSAVAVGDGAVWVANSGDGTVSEINPSSHQAVRKIVIGNSPSGIAAGRGGVWVTNSADDSVVRINPTTDQISGRFAVGAIPTAIALSTGSVWVANQAANTVTRIDPAIGAPIGAPIGVGRGPDAIAAETGGVWVANSLDGTVSWISAKTGSVAPTIPVGGRPVGLAVAGGSLWVANAGSASVQRVDLATGHVSRPIVDSSPTGVAVGMRSVWVTAAAPSSTHRGGTFTDVSAQPIIADNLQSIDPAWSYTWWLTAITNDGLVTYRRVGGAGSQAVVPDLATALPTVSDGGLTYTFQLRRDIRYSNGAQVTPNDVRYTFMRILEIGSNSAAFYKGIVGARACQFQAFGKVATPRLCDLSRGIVLNRRDYSVVFHLTHPDAAFLEELAMPFAGIVPRGTPLRQVHTMTPVPATGPYRIAKYTTTKTHAYLVLARNPMFHEWSPDAQPAGYPYQIHWEMGVPAHTQVTRTEQGSADLTFEPIPKADQPAISARFSTQLKVETQPATYSMFLNTRLPPFNNLQARRALNFAADRATLVGLEGGDQLAQPTCQILPPNFPGYQPHCPYTLNPNPDGTWTAPDFNKARLLVRQSHTAGMHVTVTADGTAPFPKFGRYFATLLDQLGYQATLNTTPDGQYHPAVARNNAADVQIGTFGWEPDYPAASNFLNNPFNCASLKTHTPGPGEDLAYTDASRLCNPGITRMANRALSLDITDPGEANLLWAKIDLRITDTAAWVPFLTPRITYLVSHRVGNFQYSTPLHGPLIDQMWVK
jgi:peptide/nickel transport system substrate-binding protein